MTQPEDDVRSARRLERDTSRTTERNVKDYGAMGDGIADDTAAFRRALTAPADLLVPIGVYLLTSIMLGIEQAKRNEGRCLDDLEKNK